MTFQTKRNGHKKTASVRTHLNFWRKYGPSDSAPSGPSAGKAQHTAPGTLPKNKQGTRERTTIGESSPPTSRSNYNQNMQPCHSSPESARHGLQNIKTIASRAISSLSTARKNKSPGTTTNCSKDTTNSTWQQSKKTENGKHENTTKTTPENAYASGNNANKQN